MDEKDKTLLSLLKQNARTPILTLARALNLSRSATQARLQRMAKDGTIRRFTIETGVNAGERHEAHVTINFVDGMNCSNVAPGLKAIAGVEAIYSVAGEHDIVVRIFGYSLADLEKTRAAVAAVKGVGGAKTLMTLDIHKG